MMIPEPVLNHLFEFLDDLLIPWIHPMTYNLSYRFHPTYLQTWIQKVLHPALLFCLSCSPGQTEKTIFYKGTPFFNQTFWTYKLPLALNNRQIAYEYSVPSTDANPTTFVWSTKTVIGPVDEFPQNTLQGGMVYNQGNCYPIYRVHMFHPSYEHVLVVEPRFARLFQQRPLPYHIIHALYPTMLEEMETAYLFAYPLW
jgi:hypothetical protein